MATLTEPTTARRLRPSRGCGDLLYFLHMAGFLASTLLITWGLFVLFFLAIGGFSFDGMMHQLDNLASRYVAADAARITSFRHVGVAHMLLAAASSSSAATSILPRDAHEGATPMADQPQLDLPPPTAPKAAQRRAGTDSADSRGLSW
jgi:hypothetical protein